jgi:hypothetical protein
MRPSSLRRLAGGVAALALVGATILSTASLTLAAVPGAKVSVEPLPAQYSAGNLAGFRATFLNTDSSTVSQLFLSVSTTGSDPNGTFYASGRVQGSTVIGACSQSLPFQCSFRNVKSGYLVVVDLAFTPSGATAGAGAIWSSVGGPTSDGGNSHGDTWDAGFASAGLSGSADYAGGFKVSANGTVSNLQVVSATNIQATRLANLPAGVAATVLDGPTATGTCTPTTTINCSTLIGEWSEVTVGDGQSFNSLFTVAITFYKGSPKAFVHSYLDTSVVPAVQAQELIQVCAKANPTYPCFTWDSKTKTATIFSFHNGSFKGQ